jgi:predicted permease
LASPNQAQRRGITWDRVGSKYFETLGTKIILGRGITDEDTPASKPVAVVNEAFVKLFFPNENPIGKRFGHGSDAKHAADYEIVGLAEDAKYTNLRAAAPPMFYLPLMQVAKFEEESQATAMLRSNYIQDIVVRATGEPATIANGVRQALAEVDPNMTVIRTTTLDDQVSAVLNQDRLIARLTILFSALALTLACVGLYGLMAYAVERRTSEIGIRMALGAKRSQVLWAVLRDSLFVIGVGIAIGVPVALAATRLVKAQLYEVEAMDPLTMTAAAIVLALVAVLAGYIPALRASRVDPMIALRYE